jgi:hypothetical protein
VANYNNSYNNKNNKNNSKICLLTRQSYGESPIFFNLKTKQDTIIPSEADTQLWAQKVGRKKLQNVEGTDWKRISWKSAVEKANEIVQYFEAVNSSKNSEQ